MLQKILLEEAKMGLLGFPKWEEEGVDLHICLDISNYSSWDGCLEEFIFHESGVFYVDLADLSAFRGSKAHPELLRVVELAEMSAFKAAFKRLGVDLDLALEDEVVRLTKEQFELLERYHERFNTNFQKFLADCRARGPVVLEESFAVPAVDSCHEEVALAVLGSSNPIKSDADEEAIELAWANNIFRYRAEVSALRPLSSVATGASCSSTEDSVAPQAVSLLPWHSTNSKVKHFVLDIHDKMG